MEGRTGLVIGIVGLVLAVPGALVALDQLGGIELPRLPWEGPQIPGGGGDGCGVTAPAEITLSTPEAPRGSEVTVHGFCFEPAERVVIRVHVTEVGSATADTAGDFEQAVTIPDSAPLNFPTDISATGSSSVKTGSAPFTVTG